MSGASTSDPLSDLPPLPSRRRPAVNWRSAVLGTLAVGLICGVTPYNDYVVQNTFLAGSYLPLAAMLLLFVLVGVNGPLHRWRREWALSAGELAVIVTMAAIASVPAQGVMRAVVATPVAPFFLGSQNAQFWEAFRSLGLPPWLFPVESIEEGRLERVVTAFYGRVGPGEPIPYGAWVVPLVGWGTFVVAAWVALLALAAIVRSQWAENERLAFPLAQIQASLLEAPSPGRALNGVFGSAGFWVGFGTVFLLQNLVALNTYFPATVPAVPLRYDLQDVLANPPWAYLAWSVKGARIYFVYLAVAFFIRSRVGFSLWFFFLLQQAINVTFRTMQAEVPDPAWRDQNLGAMMVFVVATLWIGRAHWAHVLRHMVGRPAGEPSGMYLHYAWAGWVAVAAVAVMAGWLWVVGVGIGMTCLIIAALLLTHLVTARVVAQTGLPAFRSLPMPDQIMTALPTTTWSGRDVYFAGAWSITGPYLSREVMLAFALNGMQTVEAVDPKATRRQRHGVLLLMGWALLFGSIMAAWASLRTTYSYAGPLSPGATTPFENHWGMDEFPRRFIVAPLAQHATGQWPQKPHTPWVHWSIGAAVMAMLQAGALRFPGWWLSPVGFLVCTTWYIQWAWFSILLGWVAKVTVVRYGGVRMYDAFKPLFLGLLFGEAVAAGVWMLITLYLASAGVPYETVRLLPE